jgi:thiol-disulfide isomerase/thioredoxin
MSSNNSRSIHNSVNNSGLFTKIKKFAMEINTTTYIIIALLILFSIVAFLYYNHYVLPKMKTAYKPNNELMNNENITPDTAELLFFYANWCPHCNSAKPIWNKLKSDYANKTVNGYKIIFTEIDCSEETTENDNMMQKYNVEGYPTIKLIKDGRVIDYDASPESSTLVQFLNTVL